MELKDVKEASRIELAQYEVTNKIDDEPAFAWWVHDVFKKQDIVISKANTKYWKNTHKYRVRIPKTSAESLELDRHTGQTLWVKSLKKETGKA